MGVLVVEHAPPPVFPRPYPDSFWGLELPENIAIDPLSSSVASEIVSQVGMATPIVNIDGRYSAEPYIVPKDQPLIPVTCTQDFHINAILQKGVPIPTGFVPASSGEPTLTIWMPDYVSKYGEVGVYFELYKIAQNPSTGAWSCEDACKYWGIGSSAATGRSYVWTNGPGAADYATDFDSSYTANPCVQGSGLPYWPGVVTADDCVRGEINHAVLLELVQSFGRVWPATRSDGTTSSSKIHEGDRLTLDQEDVPISGVHWLCTMLAQACVKRGCVVSDMSGAVAFRFAPSAFSYLHGAPDYTILNGFPFSKLKRIAVGSDTNPNPTS